MTLAIQPFAGNLIDRTRSWTGLGPDELRRRAVEACRDRDAVALWSLTEAHLTTWGRAGAAISVHSLRSYRTGIGSFLESAGGISLLDPPRDFGATWVRGLEGFGYKPSTASVRLAAARALYAALRWAGASRADPFKDVHPAPDATPRWEKRQPYPLEVIDALLAVASPRGVALILLCAHAGLRVGEACAVTWTDVDIATGTLRVQRGKGGKARTVVLSRRLAVALSGLDSDSNWPFLCLTPQGARAYLRRLCRRAGVEYRGLHALRHSSGTRLYHQTGDLETVARHLGHSNVETARVYAKWSDERLRQAVSGW